MIKDCSNISLLYFQSAGTLMIPGKNYTLRINDQGTSVEFTVVLKPNQSLPRNHSGEPSGIPIAIGRDVIFCRGLFFLLFLDKQKK